MKCFQVFPLVSLMACAILLSPSAVAQANPEPAGWYAGDMHVHRSCGGSPEAVSSMFSRMGPHNLSATSLLADMGNGEVQNPVTDLPLVNGKDDPISTSTRKLHWDAEWHWDATYTQYAHQALGGHIVGLGLSNAHQIWQEYTFPILDWAHQQNGIAGFAHMQYLDNANPPQSLTCCTPIEYPVEVASGAADFISEDVDDVNSGFSMQPENFIQAYYRLLNTGFRPGFAAGTDYPCNSSRDLGSLLTYVQVASGQMSYRNWINGIANGRTVVSRNGHNEFLNLVVNGTAMPGDEIQMANSGNVNVIVQWTANQNLSGIIELVQNGTLVKSQAANVTASSSATLTASVNFTKSGWLVARRVATSGGEHYVHTAAVFVTIGNSPVRTSAADAQFYTDWMSNLLTSTSAGGQWGSYFPTQRAAAQARYQAARSLFQQIVAEANGSPSTLSAITVSPASKSMSAGTEQSYAASGTYSAATLNITAQARWTSSNSLVATVNPRGLVTAVGLGTATITASLNGVSASTTLTVSTNPLTITTQSLPSGTAGTSYSGSLTASGGTVPYTWAISGGALPLGLTLNSSTGTISGTPTAAGTYSLTAQATDSSSPRQTATKPLSIVIRSSGGVTCPCTIWPVTSVPGVADSGPDSPLEIGVKFRTDKAGFITGIRFYKGVGNTGAHVGNLWSSTGTRLATVTFSGETSSGWQQASFSSPVAVSSNTTYVASYFVPNGHYADDLGFFASAGVDNSPLHALADGIDGANGVYTYSTTSSFPSLGYQSSNYWVDIVFSQTSSTTPPTINSVTPANHSSGASLGPTATAAFSEPLTASTVNGSTVVLLDSSNTSVPGNVSYSNTTSTVMLTPTVELSALTTYSVTIKGGPNGIKDLNGNAMVSDYTWSFTTGTAPANTGPGGPILVIASVLNPFSRYYGEILTAEGLNEYTVADAANVTPAFLANYEVVILGNIPLTASQVTMLTNWVNSGGNLIAMRPDKRLAGLLGLTPSASTLSNAYLLVNNSTSPGKGIVGQTIQFHGAADLYTVNGSTSLAALYSSATASSTSPAVTLANAGAGQAAAFTYDLARSIVYTRQGNPAWSGQKRDGQVPPIRSDDLYFGASSSDPQADWVNLNKVSIPQADEQQHLLANLILQMNANRKPLPRFWYFPNGLKAVVIMTGDDHANGGTAGRFDRYMADSPSGCSVTNWKCVRATAYIYPTTPITPTQVASYISSGFEVALHVTTDCLDWTPASLETTYSTQLAAFAAQFPNAPAPRTNRTHCIAWSDYDTQPQVEHKHGIRLDTNYYYWPPTWVNDRPGFFTGSGIPMRFTDRNGNLIDVYQATTQMTDESGQSYPLTINSLLDNAVGPQGFYGAFTANMHNDSVQSDGADAIIASAQARGVPVVSAQQMLTWLDGRNASSFTSLSWSSNILSFNIVAGVGATNLQAMLPTSSASRTLSAIARNGVPVSFSKQAIKGVEYAFFSAMAGSYQATYATGGSAVTVASITLNPTTVQGGGSATGTVKLSGPAPTGGVVIALSSSNTAVAQVPTVATVAANATSATFNVTTKSVSANTSVAISAAYGTTKIASLLVTAAPVTLASLTLNYKTVVGGNSSIATVTLSAVAPAGGATVSLNSNSTFAQVPGSVTVAAGATTASFTVNTRVVLNSTTATITGTYGTQRTAVLTVIPPTLYSVGLNPASLIGGSSSTATITLTGPAPEGGALIPLSSSNATVAQTPANVTVSAGSRTATVSITTTPVSVNSSVVITGTYGVIKTATLKVNAASLSSFTRSEQAVTGGGSLTGIVTLNGAAPSGGAVVTLNSDVSAAKVPASVTITAASRTATFTISTTPVAVNTTATLSAMYGVTKTTTLVVNAPTLSSLTRNPTSVVGGNNATGTVTLNGPAPAAGAAVTLASSNSSTAKVPASVTIAAGATTASFTITTSGVASTTSASVSGTYGLTRSTSLTVTVASLASLTLNPSTVTGGTSSTATLTLNGAAPPSGAVVTLNSSNMSAAQVPSTVTIPAGTKSVNFRVTTSAVHGTSSTIVGTYGYTSRSATLTVQ